MIDPDTRPARPADAGQLAQLEAESRAALADQRGGARWLSDHPGRGDAWTAVLADARVFTHVAHIGEVVVGYIVASVDANEPWLGRIDDVYVAPEARELGFGDELLAASLAVLRGAGATTLDGEALPGDRAVKNLYERAGIKARLIVVSTPL
jgi:ribosomal protein S18 acetylase RimI-like enzyme